MKKLEIFLKGIVFRLMILLSRRRVAKVKPVPANFEKVLFVRLNRIGDALVTTPLIKYLSENFNFEIHILADRKNFFAFKNNPAVDKIIVFQKGIKGIMETLKQINKRQYDCIVDMHDDVSTTVSYFIASSNAKYKFALEKENHKLFTHTIKKLDPSEHHVVERNLELIKLFNPKAEVSEKNIAIYPTEEELDKVERIIEKNFNKPRFFAGINISAGNVARFWSVERYEQLIQFFLQYDINLILLSSPADVETLDYLSDKYEVHSFFTKSFTEFSAMISKLDFLFTPDTSTVHLASAFKIPMFGLYVKYNTDNVIWYPYQTEYEAIVTEEPNFNNLSFEEVITKLKPFLERKHEEYSNS